jgi:hypothetical protein
MAREMRPAFEFCGVFSVAVVLLDGGDIVAVGATVLAADGAAKVGLIGAATGEVLTAFAFIAVAAAGVVLLGALETVFVFTEAAEVGDALIGGAAPAPTVDGGLVTLGKTVFISPE